MKSFIYLHMKNVWMLFPICVLEMNRNRLAEKRIEDFTLVALTIMIAESKPEEKEMMITVVMNCMLE